MNIFNQFKMMDNSMSTLNGPFSLPKDQFTTISHIAHNYLGNSFYAPSDDKSCIAIFGRKNFGEPRLLRITDTRSTMSSICIRTEYQQAFVSYVNMDYPNGDNYMGFAADSLANYGFDNEKLIKTPSNYGYIEANQAIYVIENDEIYYGCFSQNSAFKGYMVVDGKTQEFKRAIPLTEDGVQSGVTNYPPAISRHRKIYALTSPGDSAVNVICIDEYNGDTPASPVPVPDVDGKRMNEAGGVVVDNINDVLYVLAIHAPIDLLGETFSALHAFNTRDNSYQGVLLQHPHILGLPVIDPINQMIYLAADKGVIAFSIREGAVTNEIIIPDPDPEVEIMSMCIASYASAGSTSGELAISTSAGHTTPCNLYLIEQPATP